MLARSVARFLASTCDRRRLGLRLGLSAGVRLRLRDVALFFASACVENSRPEASGNSPSSTPRQRQIKLRAAYSLGQLVDIFWLAGHAGLVFDTGLDLVATEGRLAPPHLMIEGRAF